VAGEIIRERDGKSAHGPSSVMATAVSGESQAEGDKQNICIAVWLCHGTYLGPVTNYTVSL